MFYGVEIAQYTYYNIQNKIKLNFRYRATFQDVDWGSGGIRKNGESLKYLRLVISKSVQELRQSFKSYKWSWKASRYELNPSKTMLMANSWGEAFGIVKLKIVKLYYEWMEIDKCERSNLFWQLTSFDYSMKKELDRRITLYCRFSFFVVPRWNKRMLWASILDPNPIWVFFC